MVLASNAEVLKAELLKIDQREIEINTAIASSYKILSILTKEEIAAGTKLEWQSPEIESYVPGHNRPEYTLFSLQQQKAESLKN